MIELKILGSFITASATILVALATYIWKIQREKKESNRTIIYLLLELRNVFINSVINTDRAIDGYLKLYLEKLNDQAFSPKDKSAFEAELRIALEKAFNSLIIDKMMALISGALSLSVYLIPNPPPKFNSFTKILYVALIFAI